MKRLFVPALVLLSTTFAVAALARFELIGDSEIQFQAVGPAGLTINGTASSLSGKEEKDSIVLTTSAKGLKTGIGLRDRHLRKYINADKHSEISFRVKKSALEVPEDRKEVESQAKGVLTLNGQTKPVSFVYKAKRTGSDVHVQGRGEIDIEKFGIEIPCYLGVCVERTVKVKAKFKLRGE
jgi:polyisoprenoid-binding protein YceI